MLSSLSNTLTMEATESTATTKMDIVDTNSNGNNTVKEIVMEDDTAVEKENVGFIFPLPKDRKPTASEKANVGFVFPAPQDPKLAASEKANVGFVFRPPQDLKPAASLESSPIIFHPGPGVPVPVPVDQRRRQLMTNSRTIHLHGDSNLGISWYLKGINRIDPLIRSLNVT